MKGMNAKLVLNEPPDRNHYLLLEKLNRSCSEHDVPYAEKGRIVETGLKLFSIDTSGVHTFPLGKYPNIDDFVKANRDDPKHEGGSSLTKEQLHNRMLKAIETGAAGQYRALRKQYFAMP